MIKPQKALHLYLELEKKRTTVRDSEFVIFEKYDGWYGFKQVSQADELFERIISRQRREIPSLRRLSASIGQSERLRRVTLKGTIIFEILVAGKPVFKDLNGVLNRSKGECECEEAYLMVHDFVPDDGHDMPFLERYRLAKAYVTALAHSRVFIAPIITIGNYEDVQTEAEKIWARRSKDKSDEGTIGKSINAPYSEGKKNKDIIKVKSEVTIEMKVIGMKEGKAGGKYEGTLGTLTVQDANGMIHDVSGMTEDERDKWWFVDDSELYKYPVEIQAMQVLENGSLREGRFKAVRYDKNLSELG